MEWIKVSDRLPEDYQSVLTFCSDPKFAFNRRPVISIMEYHINRGWYVHHTKYRNVTHWMLVPEAPPKDGNLNDIHIVELRGSIYE